MKPEVVKIKITRELGELIEATKEIMRNVEGEVRVNTEKYMITFLLGTEKRGVELSDLVDVIRKYDPGAQFEIV